ncbi:cation:proton antiporter [Amycolatopsis cynarae]|uniref:Cation:proton antiporter n=1 Tax=Amycolatopsis cynarae TaxID=2995223 RepID=A0ABY7AXX1_9PSEU|nr:cation:proton antiporter [Amycolatopsis sp. HUAS 11-8]WAL63868.1 cation:proton antiporter [Amycolatopsis sp. HUAS 11-8]
MSLFGLAVVLAVGLAGPLLAAPARARVPVAVGEVLAGVVIGRTGFGWVRPEEPVLSFLATVGFALIMLVAGSHVPLRHPALRSGLRRGAGLAGLAGILAVPAGFGVAYLTGTGHGELYAVLMASSSAALVMPAIDESGLRSTPVVATIVQVALADTVCIVAVPLVMDPGRAGTAALGALAVLAAGAAGFLGVRWLRARGLLARVQRISIVRGFGLELRSQLILLFVLGGLAQAVGISVMLAGFVSGLALAAEGEPRRLARQLFAVTDGFLGPVFFVWLGASLDLRPLAVEPKLLGLAGLLAAGAVLVHAAAVLARQPLALAVLASAQLGVPIAAVTIGTREHLLTPGESGAVLAAALISVMVTGLAARAAQRRQARTEGESPR